MMEDERRKMWLPMNCNPNAISFIILYYYESNKPPSEITIFYI